MTEWWERLPRAHSARMGMEAMAEGRAEAARIQRDYAPRAAGGWRAQTSRWSGARPVPSWGPLSARTEPPLAPPGGGVGTVRLPGSRGWGNPDWGSRPTRFPVTVTAGISWQSSEELAVSGIASTDALSSISIALNNASWAAGWSPLRWVAAYYTVQGPDNLVYFECQSDDGLFNTETTYPGALRVGASPAMIPDVTGNPYGVAYLVDAGDAVAVSDASATSTITPSTLINCRSPAGCMDRTGRFWVVFSAEGGSGASASQVYLCWSDTPGSWSGPVLVSDTVPASSQEALQFPSVAVADGGSEPILLVAWRIGDASDTGSDVNISYRAAPVATILSSAGFPGAGIDSDTGEQALTAYGWASRKGGKRARDPNVFCTYGGAFFIVYTTVDLRDPQATTAAWTETPLDPASWTTATLPVAKDLEDDDQDFAFGFANGDLAQAVVVWERLSTPKRIALARCVLTGASSGWTWESLGDASDTSSDGDDDAFPCCTLDDDGTVHVFSVRSTGTSDVRFLHRRGVLP